MVCQQMEETTKECRPNRNTKYSEHIKATYGFQTNVDVAKVDIKKVQKALIKQGARIH